MGRRIVGYEGGRPIWGDNTPARARTFPGESLGGPLDPLFHIVSDGRGRGPGPRLPRAPEEADPSPMPVQTTVTPREHPMTVTSPSTGSGPVQRLAPLETAEATE